MVKTRSQAVNGETREVKSFWKTRNKIAKRPRRRKNGAVANSLQSSLNGEKSKLPKKKGIPALMDIEVPLPPFKEDDSASDLTVIKVGRKESKRQRRRKNGAMANSMQSSLNGEKSKSPKKKGIPALMDIKVPQPSSKEDDSDSDLSVICLDAVSGDIEMNASSITVSDDMEMDTSTIVIDDEGELAQSDDEMSPRKIHDAVDTAIKETEEKEAENFGAYPEYNFELVKQNILRLETLSPQIYQSTNEAIYDHYKVNLQNANTLAWKDAARMNIEKACQTVFPSARLFAVGSTMNGCGSFNSDMDICCLIDPRELYDQNNRQGKAAVIFALRKIDRAVHQIPFLGRSLLIRAVVPILQLSFKGSYEDLDVDININNMAGIYNTHLIHHYSRQDERFPALCLLIKHWALNSGINSAQDGTFNSYSLILLVVHFMQSACRPPILPNLQAVCPEAFSGKAPVEDLIFFGDEYKFVSLNTFNLTALLMGFFSYYSQFDFDKYAISVRRGRVFLKNSLPPETLRKYKIFIEEPFDHNNTARCVSADGYERVKTAFKEGNRKWNLKQRPSLQQIGIHLPTKYQ